MWSVWLSYMRGLLWNSSSFWEALEDHEFLKDLAAVHTDASLQKAFCEDVIRMKGRTHNAVDLCMFSSVLWSGSNDMFPLHRMVVIFETLVRI